MAVRYSWSEDQMVKENRMMRSLSAPPSTSAPLQIKFMPTDEILKAILKDDVPHDFKFIVSLSLEEYIKFREDYTKAFVQRSRLSNESSGSNEEITRIKRSSGIKERKTGGQKVPYKTRREPKRSYTVSNNECERPLPTPEYYGPGTKFPYDDKESKFWSHNQTPNSRNTWANEENNGLYYCKFCSATMNSRETWATHVSGKRHAKNVRQQSLHKMVLSTVSAQVFTRYPAAPPGVMRIKTNQMAKIQCVIEDLDGPCPGLEYIIEIHGLREITYYCEICDSPCSANNIVLHIMGTKHYMGCLKIIDPELHAVLQHSPRDFANKEKIEKILLKEERKQGRGYIRVEKDVPDEYCSQRPHRNQQPYHNWQFKNNEEEEYMDAEPSGAAVVPDTSKNDFYCQVCDSHMNNFNMWETHIRGKRHLKNMKKGPSDTPSGSKYRLCTQAKPQLNGYLKNVDGPIVGLDYIRETQNPFAGEMYNCFLCGACCATDIVDHLLTTKHRIKYLRKIGNQQIDQILQFELSSAARANLIEDECRSSEIRYGRGKVEVYVKMV